MLGFDYRDNHKFLIANHLNGNKLCNNLWNLEWTTAKGNTEHAIRTGLFHIQDISGEKNPMAIITENDAIVIAKMLLDGKSIKDIHIQTGISSHIIQSIKSGCSWHNIYSKYGLANLDYNAHNQVFTNTQIHKMCKYFQDNSISFLTKDIIKDICLNIGVEYSANTNKYIRKIFDKTRYIKISSQYDF